MKALAAATIVILAELAKRRVDPSQALNNAQGRRTNRAPQRDFKPSHLFTADEEGAVLQLRDLMLFLNHRVRCLRTG
jgi:hypothetical protein